MLRLLDAAALCATLLPWKEDGVKAEAPATRVAMDAIVNFMFESLWFGVEFGNNEFLDCSFESLQ